MKARICDVCGKMLEKPEKNRITREFFSEKGMFQEIKKLDICHDCMNEILKTVAIKRAERRTT